MTLRSQITRFKNLEPVLKNEPLEQDTHPEKADFKVMVPEIQSSTTQGEESENEKTGGLRSFVKEEKNPGPHLQCSL